MTEDPMEREYMQPEPDVAGRAISLWIDTTDAKEYQSLRGRHETDVAVIGGGLTGVLTAALLRQEGLRVALIEKRRVGTGATGHTTAKITAQHGLVYRKLLDHVGEHAATVYAEANMSGLNLVESLAQRHRIDCDFHRTPFDLFAESDDQAAAIRAEVDAARRLGLPATLVPPREHPFPMRESLRLDAQAQFHPLKFLLGLLQRLEGEGFVVFEQTRALDIEDEEPCRVVCERGEVVAGRIVVATHFPFYDKGGFFARLYPYMAWAMSLRLPGATEPAMLFSDGSPEYGVRTHPAPGDTGLIVSGLNAHSGRAGDEREMYRRLLEHTRARYGSAAVAHHWSTEDFYTPDDLPFIGFSPGSRRILLATGFAGWGMTSAAASAILLHDLVLGKDHPWKEVFSPARVRPAASAGRFLRENAGVAAQLVKGKASGGVSRHPDSLTPGEGALVTHEGRRYAAYREPTGRLHLLDPTCTHLGCTVTFNEAEKTWDCPCHGSRFSFDGQPVDGPAIRDLDSTRRAD